MYDRRVGDHRLSFGVSGYLYKGNLLLYDRQTESLWSQITAQAVAGRLTGMRLNSIPFVIATWQSWKAEHPDTLALSNRAFPAVFSAAFNSLGWVFKTVFAPLRLFAGEPDTTRPEDLVLGVDIQGVKKAYPFKVLVQHTSPFTDMVGEEEIRVFFHVDSFFAYAESGQGERLPSIVTYRAVWFSFYPDSQMYQTAVR